MNELIVGNFRVDITRSLLHRDTDTVTLEPKVLQVLLFLAKHQGEVVNHQALLSAIWPNSIVDPSSLQRCIALLRKAFQDNAKEQRVIATYPKNGYSLIPAIHWNSVNTPTASVPRLRISLFQSLGAAAIIVLIVIVANLFSLFKTNPTIDATLTAIETALTPEPVNASGLETTNSDFYAIYSANGRYVVYPRFIEGQLSQLWAQNLIDGNEFLLTAQLAHYSYAAWSPDNEHIAFVQSDCSNPNCLTATCSSLSILSVEELDAASNSDTNNSDIKNQQRQLINCRSIQIQSPEWLSTTDIAMIENNGQRSTIIKFGINDGSHEVLYQQPGKVPYQLTYSASAQKLAISLSNEDSQLELLLLTVATGHFTLIPISIPETNPVQSWHTSWNPQANGLLVSNFSKVYSVSLDGIVSEQSFPFLP